MFLNLIFLYFLNFVEILIFFVMLGIVVKESIGRRRKEEGEKR